MSSDTALRTRADQIHNRYAFAFAGKPRATRRLEELDAILTDARHLRDEVQRGGGDELKALLAERLGVYEQERAAIAQVQAAGPLVRAAAVLATRANVAFGVYRRAFAGQNRRTRDLALLDDVVAWIAQIRDDASALAVSIRDTAVHDDLDVMQRNLDAYTAERGMIAEAQQQGTPEERAGALADRANAQFETYRVHFAGRERLSRRPALLRRVIGALESIGGEMAALSSAGFEAEFHDKNRGIVAERLEAYRKELTAIGEVREKTDVDSLISALAREANAIMEEYQQHFAGKERATRDLTLLANLTDRMTEIERQMWDLDRALEDPTNARNLGIVHDMLLVYLREYDLVREARTN